MSFKTVLAIVGVSNAATDLNNAINLVTDSDTHLSILVLGAATLPIAADYPISTAWLEEREAEIDRLLKIRDMAEDLCRKNSVSCDVDTIYDDRFILANNIRTRALYADLVVVGPSARRDTDLLKALTTAVVFEAGTPALLMPATGAVSLSPRNVLLAWNSRPEAANAAKAALNMMETAQATHVVLVNPDSNYFKNGGEPGADIATFLARHGVETTVCQLAGGQRPVEEVLRQHALEMGCDLIVMGAYSHSRLRERIFGGVTSSLIEECDFPIFLAR